MAEKAIFTARAVVYYFDSAKRQWTPTAVGQAFCRADMYENTATNSFRVIGRGLQDNTKVVINSNVTKDTSYTRASETFHQWSDNKYIYGLNFGTKEEAEAFGVGFENVIKRLKEGGGAPAPPAPAPVAPAPVAPKAPSAPPAPAPAPPAAPKAPAAPPAPAPPAPPSAPPAPAPPAAPPAPTAKLGGGDPDAGRSALLSSITGFKGGLKKVQTVDKSAPIIEKGGSGGGGATKSGGGGGDMMAEMLAKRSKMAQKNESSSTLKKTTPPPAPSPAASPAPAPKFTAPQIDPSKASLKKTTPPSPASTPSLGGSGGGGASSSDLQALKEEILAEIRTELQQMKDEILAAIQNR